MNEKPKWQRARLISALRTEEQIFVGLEIWIYGASRRQTDVQVAALDDVPTVPGRWIYTTNIALRAGYASIDAERQSSYLRARPKISATSQNRYRGLISCRWRDSGARR